MKTQIVAVALTALLAAPATAPAQSSVTISGYFKASFENIKLSQTVKSPGSETRVSDDSSRIVFSVREDLGGGLAAIGQLDVRFKLDDGGAVAATNVGGNIGAGNTFVGLRSKGWGTLSAGRHDLHYTHNRSEITFKAGSYKADDLALLAFAGGGGTAVAVNSRTLNAVRFDSPRWGGFAFTAAYSTNPAAADSDIGSGIRKGRAWNLNPNLEGANYQIGYSYWSQKADGAVSAASSAIAGCAAGGVVTISAAGAVTSTCATGGTVTFTAAGVAAADQRGDRLYGSYSWGGLRLGVTWDRAELKNGVTGALTSRRTAWSLPLRYRTGVHNFYAGYTGARDDRASAAADGAKMVALAYAYDMSKRTSAGISYARINNDAGATYNLYGSAGGQGSASAAVAAGEDPRIWAITLRHAF